MPQLERWLAALGLVILACAASCGPHAGSTSPRAEPSSRVPQSQAPASAATAAPTGLDARFRTVVDDVTVLDHGEPVHRGRVDLSASIRRIVAGEKHPHRNDGSVFQNRERLLPSRERGYYREYVHPTPGVNGAGPQRLVVGEGGEWYYTPDHYRSFVRIDKGGAG